MKVDAFPVSVIALIWAAAFGMAAVAWSKASEEADAWEALAYSYKHDAEAARSDARRYKSELDFCISTIAERCGK